jgi:hypothetical protein
MADGTSGMQLILLTTCLPGGLRFAWDTIGSLEFIFWPSIYAKSRQSQLPPNILEIVETLPAF